MKMQMTERYINPHTDFGFKRLFGSEFNKELLISFLNAIFAGKQEIKDVTYMNTEQLGERIESRRAIFDVYCDTESGEKFIVEMQNVYQEFFKDRTIYYSTFPIREQAKKGEWDFHLNGVYTVGLLNFIFEDKGKDADRMQHEVKLMDVDTKKVFLRQAHISLPGNTKVQQDGNGISDNVRQVDVRIEEPFTTAGTSRRLAGAGLHPAVRAGRNSKVQYSGIEGIRRKHERLP